MNDNDQKGFRYGVRHASVVASTSLLEFVDAELIKEKNRSDLTALELVEMGSVYVNDERCVNSARALSAGANVRIHTSPRRFARPTNLRERIVREDNDMILVDKPPGLPVHALVDNIKENLLSFLEDVRGETFFITHRLDVETSGLVLFAKSALAQSRINAAFVEGSVKRTYVAYVEKPVEPRTYVHFMEPSPKAPKRVEAESHEGWQRCSLSILRCDDQSAATNSISEGYTTWLLEGSVSKLYRLEIQLQTGRPQQIRAQLAALGAPIVGDTSYGSNLHLTEANTRAIALRASALNFDVLHVR